MRSQHVNQVKMSDIVVLEPGHKYKLPHLESEGFEIVRFVRRSSAMVDYAQKEHPGTNTQRVIRMLIDRTLYLDAVGTDVDTLDAVYFLRMALFAYEARAWRRKQAKLNKAAVGTPEHDGKDNLSDIPFSEHEIEDLPTGPDGHIIVR